MISRTSRQNVAAKSEHVSKHEADNLLSKDSVCLFLLHMFASLSEQMDRTLILKHHLFSLYDFASMTLVYFVFLDITAIIPSKTINSVTLTKYIVITNQWFPGLVPSPIFPVCRKPVRIFYLTISVVYQRLLKCGCDLVSDCLCSYIFLTFDRVYCAYRWDVSETAPLLPCDSVVKF